MHYNSFLFFARISQFASAALLSCHTWRNRRGSVTVVLTTAPQRPGEAACSTFLPAHPQMINPCLSFSQMGKTSQRTLQSRKASALGVAANARRRLHMQTEQAHPAGTSPPSPGSMEFGDPLEAMATCGGETMSTGGVLLEGDCLDGILALLTAKALCPVMRTCRALEEECLKATTVWSHPQ